MSFIHDVTKPSFEVIFSKKNIKPNHPEKHKDIGLTLDKELDFQSHVKESIKKANKVLE